MQNPVWTGFVKLLFFFQAEDCIGNPSVTGVQTCPFLFKVEGGIRDSSVTGVQTCALPISSSRSMRSPPEARWATRMLREEVTAEDIAKVVSSWTNIPVARMLQGEREKLLSMEDSIHKRIDRKSVV